VFYICLVEVKRPTLEAFPRCVMSSYRMDVRILTPWSVASLFIHITDMITITLHSWNFYCGHVC